MKEINDQLYGYSYELDTTSESDGTKCFAVDTGTVFVAYKGVWYEQPGSFWAASISEGEDDLFKTSWEISKIVPDDDLLVINAVDTGKRYVSFNGKWYAQPVLWSAPAAGGGGAGGGLPDPSYGNDGDVLTIYYGSWEPRAPIAPLVVELDDTGEYLRSDLYTSDIYSAFFGGQPVIFRFMAQDGTGGALVYTLVSMSTDGSGDYVLVVASTATPKLEKVTADSSSHVNIPNPFILGGG